MGQAAVPTSSCAPSCPNCSESLGTMERRMMSEPPPGPYGMITRTGLCGNACAATGAALNTADDNSTSEAHHRGSFIEILLLPVAQQGALRITRPAFLFP